MIRIFIFINQVEVCDLYHNSHTQMTRPCFPWQLQWTRFYGDHGGRARIKIFHDLPRKFPTM